MAETIKRDITRRDAMKMVALAPLALAGPKNAEAKNFEIDFFPSKLDKKSLETQRDKAVNSLIQAFAQHPAPRQYILRQYFKGARELSDVQNILRGESRMFVPTREESLDVFARFLNHFQTLGKEIHPDKYGLFIDGDKQKMYVLQRTDSNRIHFIKGYLISSSNQPWNNALNSGGTPVGLHRIGEDRRGLLGEIVAASQPNSRDYEVVDGKPFARNISNKGQGVADMLTRRFLLLGPTTSIKRAINIHGTDRPERLGNRASGGCLRIANVDVEDLGEFVEVGAHRRPDGTDIQGGTPVMIQASRK